MNKIVDLYTQFTSFEGSLFRYSLSFSLLLALAPGLTIFVMLFVFAYLDPTIIIDFATKLLPSEYVTPFVEFIISRGNYSTTPVFTTLLIALWLASRAVYSFLLINAQHESIEVPKWAIRIKSILIFLALSLYVVATLYLLTQINFHSFSFLLPFIGALALLIGFILFYRGLSFEKKELSYGLLGGLFSTVSIMGTAYLFFLVLNQFTDYSTIYGPLASLVVLLLSIYILSCLIYFGYLLNVVYEEESQSIKMKHALYYNFCSRIHELVIEHIKFKFIK